MMRGDKLETVRNALTSDFINANEIEKITGIQLNTVNSSLRKLNVMDQLDIEERFNHKLGKMVKHYKLKGDEMRVNISHYLEMLRFCTDEYKSVTDIYLHLGLLKPVTAKHLIKLYDNGLMESKLLKDGVRGAGIRMYKAVLGWSEEEVKKAFKQALAPPKKESHYISTPSVGHTVVRGLNGYHTTRTPRAVNYGVGIGKS
jgi:DNA-binding transcriptional ArsR family regulator